MFHKNSLAQCGYLTQFPTLSNMTPWLNFKTFKVYKFNSPSSRSPQIFKNTRRVIEQPICYWFKLFSSWQVCTTNLFYKTSNSLTNFKSIQKLCTTDLLLTTKVLSEILQNTLVNWYQGPGPEWALVLAFIMKTFACGDVIV